jgi:hypothetical protein
MVHLLLAALASCEDPVIRFGWTFIGEQFLPGISCAELFFCRFKKIGQRFGHFNPASAVKISDITAYVLVYDWVFIDCSGGEWDAVMLFDSTRADVIRTCASQCMAQVMGAFVQLGGITRGVTSERCVRDCTALKCKATRGAPDRGGCITANRDPIHVTGVNFTSCGQMGATAIGLFHVEASGQQFELYADFLFVLDCAGSASIVIESQERKSYINNSIFLNSQNSVAVIDTS